MRSAYEPIPWLSAAAAPKVVSASGLGTGGGASVQTSDGSGFGHVVLQCGPNPDAAGSVVLKYGAIPPTMFYACRFGALSVAGQGTDTHTLSWTGASFGGARQALIAYEWETSR